MGLKGWLHNHQINRANSLKLLEYMRFWMDVGSFWLPFNNEIVIVLGASVGVAGVLVANNFLGSLAGLVPVIILNIYKLIMGWLDVTWKISYKRRSSLGLENNDFMVALKEKLDKIEGKLNVQAAG